ncbi:MAG: hypothetical protein H0X24_01280 [Ktedonobacterales bacterium]|nr:hypothetical protein [Ktedonobacterales bacterium]
MDLYARRLWQTRGYPGRDYLKRRGISDRTAREHRLGYCDGDDLSDLVAELRRRHIPAQAALDIGLIAGKTGKERFVQRITIPEIRGGQVRWLTGRHLQDVDNKYLNVYGPRHLLGADALYDRGEILGDEGPLNWLTLRQWGLPAFSFVGGTMPDEGYQWLTAAGRVYLPFQRDLPGWTAARRLAPILDAQVELLCLPAEWRGRRIKDVNDLIRDGFDDAAGYRCFTACGRAAIPWHERYLAMDFQDLPILLPAAR